MCEPFIGVALPTSGAVGDYSGRRDRQPLLHDRHVCGPAGSELDVNLLIKATKVDGVYSADPKKDPGAKLFDRISYDEVLQRGLRIMDHAAISLCQENGIPITVLNIFKKGNIAKAICGESVGTVIGPA